MEIKQQCLKNSGPMRQALVLGSLINLVGIILSVTVDPRYIVFSIIVSMGLLISGLIGWCPMAYFLEKVQVKRK
jgi:hypothetical protein